MPVSIHQRLSLSPNTFALIIAPQETLCEALTVMLTRHQGHILYLCGNYPEILPGLVSGSDRLRIRRALTAYQILSILDDTSESLTLFEHDRSLYEDTADLLVPIGERCRQRASETGLVVLFAARPDTWLNGLQQYADRVVVVIGRSHSQVRTRKKVWSEQQLLDVS